MPYASKELIERAVAYLNHPEGVPLAESIFAIVSDLREATPLPDNWCAPVGDAIMGEYRPDAEHEAAIEAWHGKVAEALAAVDIGYMRDPGTPGSRAFEELFRLADDAVKLARRAPRPEPDPEQRLGDPSAVALNGPGVEVYRKEFAQPEPRASSALLAAAKAATETYRSGSSSSTLRSMELLRRAIEAEEARGPSEVEKLRKDRDEAINRADGLRSDVDYWQNIVTASVKACGYPGLLHSELVSHVEQLRDERDEAVARAEKAERERDKAIDRANAKFAKLQLLREWVEDDDDGSGDGLVDRANLVDKIDTLLLQQMSEPNHASDDLPLGGWLRRKVEGCISSHEVLEDVVELLVRRSLAVGAK